MSVDSGVLRESLDVMAGGQLAREGYDHFGDLSYYAFNDKGYLVVALEGKEGVSPAMAVLDAASLIFIW